MWLDTLPGEAAILEMFWPPFWKVVYCKRRKFAPTARNFFVFWVNPFQKRISCANRKLEKLSPLWKMTEKCQIYPIPLTLKTPNTTIVICFVSAEYFKSYCCKRCGPRSDCFSRSSLMWVRTVCLYAKSMFEKFARSCSRLHKQTTF